MKRTNAKWIIGGLILGTALGIFSCSTPKKTDKGTLHLGIIQPLKESVEFEDSTFNAEDGLEHVLSTGSKVTIPKDALIDKNGNPVTGKCELKFREFHSSEDIFLSGITMQLDEQGKEYMSSGGMMEIRVEQNGEELQLAPGKSVDIELVSEVDTKEGFQLFKLENDKSWSEGRSFERIPNKRKNQKLEQIQDDLDSMDGTFTINTNFDLRPYMSMWKDVEWKLVNCRGELPWSEVNEVIWDYVQINSSRSRKGIYQIEVVSTMHTYNGKMKQWQNQVYAIPQVDEETLAKLTVRQKKEDAKRDRKFAKLREEQKKYELDQKAWEAEMLRQAEETAKARQEYLLQQQKRTMAQNEMLNSFKIRGFGIYNIDRLCKINPSAYVAVNFDFENENDLSMMYLIVKEDRSVIRLSPNVNLPKLNMECSVVLVTKDAGIGYISPEQYDEKIKNAKPDEVITLKPEKKNQDELAQLFRPSLPPRPKFA